MGQCTPLYARYRHHDRVLLSRPCGIGFPHNRSRIAGDGMRGASWTIHRLRPSNKKSAGGIAIGKTSPRSNGRQEFVRAYRHSRGSRDRISGTRGIPYVSSIGYTAEIGGSRRGDCRRRRRRSSGDHNLARILLSLICRSRPPRLSTINIHCRDPIVLAPATRPRRTNHSRKTADLPDGGNWEDDEALFAGTRVRGCGAGGTAECRVSGESYCWGFDVYAMSLIALGRRAQREEVSERNL